MTIEVDPESGEPAQSVDPLVRSRGVEIGGRFFRSGVLNASMALWLLDLDSELLFVGDAGNTEPSRASRRHGVELTAYWWLSPHWTLDAEYACSWARFTEPDPGDPDAGDQISGSIPSVFSTGLSLDHPSGWFGSARLRYFSPRPLDESGDIESAGSTVVNLRAGYRWQLFGDVLNLFDSEDHDIDYYSTSRLAGEPLAGVDDTHFHPLEPRTYRLYLGYRIGG